MTNATWLQTVEKVAEFLNTQAEHNEVGLYWQRKLESEKPAPQTLYHGNAGVVLFYLELHRASANPAHLQTAVQGGRALAAHLKQQLATNERMGIGIHTGLPGYVFVLNTLAMESGDHTFRDMALRVYERLMEQASSLGDGIGWIDEIPFADITGVSGEREILDLSVGAAGTGLVCLYAAEHKLHTDALSHAKQVCDRLLEVAEETSAGLTWPVMMDQPWPFKAPNFAHGAAGVGYFLAQTYQHVDDPRYLEGAIAAANHVMSFSKPCGSGHLVCHTEDGPDLFYLGACHGPVGTGRLMFSLYEITREQRWLDWIDANMQGLLATGAPEKRSRGLWQNYGQCCGDAGIGDYACFLYRHTGKSIYQDLATRVGEYLLTTSSSMEGGMAWTQAEHRNRPDFLETQVGYMQGAAGIGSFYLNLATLDATESAKIKQPDIPFK